MHSCTIISTHAIHYFYFTSERKCATVVVVAGGNLKAVFDPLIFVFHSSLSKGFCLCLIF